LRVVTSHESNVMDKQFEKRMMRAKNPRARRRNGKAKAKFVRRSNVGNVLDEIANAPERGLLGAGPWKATVDLAATSVLPIAVAEQLAIAAVQDGVAAVKKRMGKKKRWLALEKRRKYYAAAAVKREEMRAQIRAAMPKPAHRCPTAQELIEAYLNRREGEEWQRRFGELMIDLEEHARREYAITGNKFTGSAGGVKEWLKERCPLLAKHYATCQRYKRLAQEYYDT